MPTPVEAQGLVFTRVACGKTHIIAITNNGKLLSWGDPDLGKLGHQKKELTDEEKKSQYLDYRKHGYHPKSLPNLKNEVGFVAGEISDKQVVDVACGQHHTACITK